MLIYFVLVEMKYWLVFLFFVWMNEFNNQMNGSYTNQKIILHSICKQLVSGVVCVVFGWKNPDQDIFGGDLHLFWQRWKYNNILRSTLNVSSSPDYNIKRAVAINTLKHRKHTRQRWKYNNILRSTLNVSTCTNSITEIC